MPDALSSAIIAFLAAVGGGLLQVWSTSLREKRNFRWNMHRENYGLYLQAIAGMGRNFTPGPVRDGYIQMSLEATAKILLQGSPEVIRWLKIIQDHGIFSTEESYLDFARLTEAMRRDVGGNTMDDFVPLARAILFENPVEDQSA
jgi:hypothetical protein